MGGLRGCWDVLGGFGEPLGDNGFVFAGQEHHRRSEEDGAEGGYLGVRHGVSEVELGVDADELYEEASDAAEDEVFAGEEAQGDGFRAALPKPPGEGEGKEELVDWGGLDEGGRWIGRDKGVFCHVDAPGEGGVDAVVAVAGGEAADATDAVADGSGGGGEVQHAKGSAMATKAVWLGDVALEHEHGDAGKQAAEPGEAGLEPVQEVEQNVSGVVDAGEEDLLPGELEFADVFELMPELGADDAGEDDHGDDVEGVGVDAVANEVSVQHDGAGDGGEPEEEAEGSYVRKTEIQIGIHAGISITAADCDCRAGWGRGGRNRNGPRFPQRGGEGFPFSWGQVSRSLSACLLLFLRLSLPR